MKKILWILLPVAVACTVWWGLGRRGHATEASWRFVQVEKGDIESVVSATGTLGAVTTVQVGTQVSGSVASIYADFNDEVELGQVVARIDTTLLASAVRDAEAGVDRARAETGQADREYRRISKLWEKSLVAETEMFKAQYDLDIARASARSAQVGLERAERNLDYATICAPIAGTVIERNVDVGQTVAASLSTPQLFLIAEDLARMQILVSVDESDIGTIIEGQSARFTVQAYPDESFTGTVRQVRLQSLVTENVVNYTVVVDVSNEEYKLLPGMTATVDFLIETAADVLMVTNAALRFKPSEELQAAAMQRRRAEREKRRSEGGQSDSAQLGGRPGGMSPSGPGSGQRPTFLWYVNEEGRLDFHPVRTGTTDGQYTEIMGREIEEGLQIVAGIASSSQGQTSNPFQQGNQQRRGPPRPGGI